MTQDGHDKALVPIPSDPSFVVKQHERAVNTCYIDSLITAMFYPLDLADPLLKLQRFRCDQHIVVSLLMTSINQIRSGEGLKTSTVSFLRFALQENGWYLGDQQEDVLEFFLFLSGVLKAPQIPLYVSLAHPGEPSPRDNELKFESVIFLDMYNGPRFEDALDHYFFHETIPELQRGTQVSASIRKWIFTPSQVEQAPDMNAIEPNLQSVMRCIPIIVKRYRYGEQKNRDTLTLATSIPATKYVKNKMDGVEYTLVLRSAVCHLGAQQQFGHYVCHTWQPDIGWRRWDDLALGKVRTVLADHRTSEPCNSYWKTEIERDGYMFFYELVESIRSENVM